MTGADWIASLTADGDALGRVSTAERVADFVRTRVMEGDLPPGTRLSEEALRTALGVARNTLREAFRLLTRERLLVHEHSRGVFVRTPGVADILDLYAARRVIEGGALSAWRTAPEEKRQAVRDAVRFQRESAQAERWSDVATGNVRFHLAITGLAGSARLDEEVRRLLAEMRLVFHHMGDQREFYENYVQLNRDILELADGGAVREAEEALRKYFDVAEQHLLRRMRAHG
ncbi:GntR family transcriptional regulator [Lentzea flaviverrucosa]|uniref:DNA-binding transcriptional regulator, GntR family n=1 Tax=Lentzea flaviverrucosa TaxID=200379 RepID=A0A1H9XEL7_9PSEU|nr:GntR family transcriptional regulator [Lentzea flaviverrucosa]RDI21499.1 GntR family transcriptional regulator [Lentzea flaviverrucosa]SES44564.1 DNA-binding transcriptional regulator, GntR family [Lentzea flaviverrucosa]